jgi:WD40 repeat protein
MSKSLESLMNRMILLYSFQNAVMQLEAVFPFRYRCSFQLRALYAIKSHLYSHERQLLIAGGQLSVILTQRLLCFKGKCSVRSPLRLGLSILSRRHFFNKSKARCIVAFTEHKDSVTCVAFHPTAPILATCSNDTTIKLWKMSPDSSEPIYITTLKGHLSNVWSVAFHPILPILATSYDGYTVKLWQLSPDGTAATCLKTFDGHRNTVFSVAFHPTAPILATSSREVKLWRLSSDGSTVIVTYETTRWGHFDTTVTPIMTLSEHFDSVGSVTFHPILPILATGSKDKTAKLWRLSPDCSAATCVATLKGHSHNICSVAFHPTLPILATGSDDYTVKLWQMSHDGSGANCVATLKEHRLYVWSVAFHPILPILATGSADRTVKLWQLSPEGSAATCFMTLDNNKYVRSVAFHPTASILVTNGEHKTAKLWC